MTDVHIRMTISHEHPGVHDGRGGVHRSGSTPKLPEDVAAEFVKMGHAEYSEHWPVRLIRSVGRKWQQLEYREKMATIALVVAIFGLLTAFMKK